MWMKRRHRWAGGLPVLLTAAACGRGDDLSRAIDGGVGRTVTPPALVATAADWVQAGQGSDAVVPIPMSLCWLDSTLVVADAGRQGLEVFDSRGRHRGGFGRRGSGPGEFKQISAVRCSEDGQTILAADAGSRRISFLGPDGAFRGGTDAPSTPQGIPYLGDFVVANDGRWFDSWLGARVGPYLSDRDWKSVRLVRGWSQAGEALAGFGEPFSYDNPVVRRVFNHVDLALHRDTIWLLSQANAVIQAFDLKGDRATDPVFLPLYHRGIDPVVELGNGALPGGYRRNRALYQPNVRGIAVVMDTLFAIIRYQDWREVRRGEGEDGFSDFWPRSSIEIVDRRGKVRMALAAPGRVGAIAADGGSNIAILSEDLETAVKSVMILHLPSPPAG